MSLFNGLPAPIHAHSTKILGLRSRTCVSAVALDLDLWGFGSSDEEAVDSLRKNIEIQIAFAFTRENIDLFPYATLDEHFQLFNSCRFDYLRQYPMINCFITSLPYPIPANVEFVTPTENECFHKLLDTLQQYDQRFEGYQCKSQPGQSILFHPNINTHSVAYSFCCIAPFGELIDGHSKPIMRRFRLPKGLIGNG